MIFKVQDVINRAINSLYNISQIDLRYLSDSEKDSLLSEYNKIIDGVYTNVCSEFDESLLEISKACTKCLENYKTMVDKLRVYYKSSHGNHKFIKMNYDLTLKGIKNQYNTKISGITLDKLKNKSLLELYLENCRGILKDFDSNILLSNYDIHNMKDVVTALEKSPITIDANFKNDNEMINYLTKTYVEYSSIIKWCDSVIESTYQKLTEYKQYVERDISCKNKGSNQLYAKEACTNSIYAILFFSLAYILTENILKFYMSIISLSLINLNTYIEGVI